MKAVGTPFPIYSALALRPTKTTTITVNQAKQTTKTKQNKNNPIKQQ